MRYEYNQFAFYSRYLLNNFDQYLKHFDLRKAKIIAIKILRELNLEMHIVWSADDILELTQQHIVKDSNLYTENNISQADCKFVLNYLYQNYDRSVGINEELVINTIETLAQKNKIQIYY